MVFSSLVVVSFLDTIIIWGYESYLKTKEKAEWLVVPIIIICAYVMGLLQAVFLGVGLSTFLFVAAFFRSGVVKYLSNGLVIRSTIERSLDASRWLDLHGDKIQVVVLQNYLFFGNASSMLEYISNMFEEENENNNHTELEAFSTPLQSHHHSSPPPKYIILDLTLVTGMDTSTVDVLSDIKTICITNECKLYIAGLSPPLRATVAMGGGLKPEKKGKRSNVRFFSDLDDAIGKAEDNLLLDEVMVGGVDMFDQNNNSYNNNHNHNHNNADNHQNIISFQRALHAIDMQHGRDFASELIDLHPYTTPIHLEAGNGLYSSEGGPVDDQNHGFFFIASGMMKIERDRAFTLTRGASSCYAGPNNLSFSAGYPNNQKIMEEESFIRLARVGPGWVIGVLEGLHAERYPGHHLAVTSCTLHHLPFHKIKEIEEKDPKLVIRLYKLVSHLMARKAEITIGQLVTLHSIMTSPVAQIRRRRKSSRISR